MNRGIESELEAAAPELALKVGGAGAKLRFTVAVPGGGEFCATLETNVSYTANFTDSLALGVGVDDFPNRRGAAVDHVDFGDWHVAAVRPEVRARHTWEEGAAGSVVAVARGFAAHQLSESGR